MIGEYDQLRSSGMNRDEALRKLAAAHGCSARAVSRAVAAAVQAGQLPRWAPRAHLLTGGDLDAARAALALRSQLFTEDVATLWTRHYRRDGHGYRLTVALLGRILGHSTRSIQRHVARARRQGLISS